MFQWFENLSRAFAEREQQSRSQSRFVRKFPSGSIRLSPFSAPNKSFRELHRKPFAYACPANPVFQRAFQFVVPSRELPRGLRAISLGVPQSEQLLVVLAFVRASGFLLACPLP